MTYTTALTRAELNSGVLQTWLNRTVLENFEPNLYFYKMGEKPSTPKGYNTIGWPKYDQVSESSVSSLTDGVTPAFIDFDATVITATPTQYGVVISLSDMLIDLTVINFVEGALVEIGSAMARKIDSVIQTTIMAGTNVFYGGAKTARTALLATSVLTAALLNKASIRLEAAYAPKIDGYYVAFVHPYQVYDLRSESGTGNWLEVNKYDNSVQVQKGEVGMLNGVRVIMSPFIQKFSSTVDVYPCLVIGKGAYGVADFQSLQTYITPAQSSDSDPLAQRRKVGSKVAFAAKRLQENAMQRIETGVTDIT